MELLVTNSDDALYDSTVADNFDWLAAYQRAAPAGLDFLQEGDSVVHRAGVIRVQTLDAVRERS